MRRPLKLKSAMVMVLFTVLFAWTQAGAMEVAHPEARVDVNWLKEHYKDPNVVILDGSDVKDDTYTPHTVKGAVHISYRDLRQPSGLMKGITFGLEKEAFNAEPLEEIFRKAGVNDDSTVVCAGQYRVDDAALLFWTLKWLGHEDVRLLPVNYLKVLPEELVSLTVPSWNKVDHKGNFKAEVDWTWYATREDAIRAVHDPMTGLWDARPESYYMGEKTKTIRGGTIATARNLPASKMWTDKSESTVDWGGIAKKLDRLFPDKGDKEMNIISFCNSGHSCTVGYFAWQLGHPWRLLDSSWNMLAFDGSLPAQNVQLFLKP